VPRAIIDPQKCLRCKKCLAAKVCPVKAIFRIDEEESAVVEVRLCHGCGDCVIVCKAGAIVLKEA
jgi:MinD superfamily P-loop ATPase